MLYAKLQRKFQPCKSLSAKTVALHGANARFVGCRAESGLEVEGWEVGFVDFAEAEGVGDKTFASFDFYEVFATLPTVIEGETNGVLVVIGLKIPFTTISVTGV